VGGAQGQARAGDLMADSKTDDSQALETEIRRRITGAGPMPVGQYMALCLTDPEHGYYMQRDPLGARGDFITAPEISQMFGELLGLWSMAVWKLMGEPDSLRLIELGPGRGTMMLDILRTAYALPEFRKALRLHFVEVSPLLEERQRRAISSSNVPVEWHKTLDQVPYGPSIVLANEFFDALPVQQAVMCVDGWHERVVKLDQQGRLQYSNARDPIPLFEQMLPKTLRDAAIGEIFEWRADNVALELGRRVARTAGAALVIDYGHIESATGDTLQAVGQHTYANPLQGPGTVDLTAHVDFQALAQAAESMGARVFGPLDQAAFLRNLGIESRAAVLRKAVPPSKVPEIDSALERLTSTARLGMGQLFKVIGFAHPKIGALPAF
jgi:NADH dehydrogenase [ubiquinone] 1 alpha subcomplex assembly factor 7